MENYDIFHVSLLEQDTTRKGRVEEKTSQLQLQDNDKGEEYKVKAIPDSAVYAKEFESGQLPGLYYPISWKDFPEDENIWESASAFPHLRRLVNTFHKENPDKPTVTSTPVDTAPSNSTPVNTALLNSTPVDTAPPMARATVMPGAWSNKQKRAQTANVNSTRKRSKKN